MRNFIVGTALSAVSCFFAFPARAAETGDSWRNSHAGAGMFLNTFHLNSLLRADAFTGMAAACLLAVFLYYAVKKFQQRSFLNRMPSGEGIKKAAGYERFIAANPGFSREDFLAKVKKTFTDMQLARARKDLSDVRKFISGGVYRLFSTQFVMADLAGMEMTLREMEIRNIYIDRVDADGAYDIIHAAVCSSVTWDMAARGEQSPGRTEHEESVQYWSFIKMRGSPAMDIYFTNNCPGCGTPVPEGRDEPGRCVSCDAVTNSGKFDWVLASIREADDYLIAGGKRGKTGALNAKIRGMLNEGDGFSLTLLEDMAADGYLQVVASEALNDPSMMRRFINDATFEKITVDMAGETAAYCGMHINDVTVVGVSENRSLNIIAVLAVSSSRRTVPVAGAASGAGPVMNSESRVLIMSRDKNPVRPRGSLYAHFCPACGARVEDSPELKCPSCGTAMNSTAYGWVVTDMMSVQEYNDYYSEYAADFNYIVNPASLDRAYDVRDFAFNNAMAFMASRCGSPEETLGCGRELAVKWKYNPGKIEPFLRMAMNGRLVIRMPADGAKRVKVYSMMMEAAAGPGAPAAGTCFVKT